MKRLFPLLLFLILLIASTFGVFSKLDTNSQPMFSSTTSSVLTVSDLNWTVGAFDSYNRTLTYFGMDGFTCEIDDQIHFLETGWGTYYPVDVNYVSVGAFATVPVNNGRLYFTFEGRARANHSDAVNLLIRIYESDPLYLLNSSSSDPEHIGGIIQPDELDTDYICIENDILLEGYEEVTIFLFYKDYWEPNWNQEIWIKDLRIYTDLIPTEDYFTLDDLDWNFGCFPGGSYDHGYPTPTLGNYSYEINSSSFHVWEIENTYMFNVGGYALLPIQTNEVNLSFEARAKASHTDAVDLGVILLDPSNYSFTGSGQWLYNHEIVDGYDTGFRFFNIIIPIEGYREVLLFFYYGDYWSASWNQEIWIKDLKIYPSEFNCTAGCQETDTSENPSKETFTINHPVIFSTIIALSILITLSKKLQRRRQFKYE